MTAAQQRFAISCDAANFVLEFCREPDGLWRADFDDCRSFMRRFEGGRYAYAIRRGEVCVQSGVEPDRDTAGKRIAQYALGLRVGYAPAEP